MKIIIAPDSFKGSLTAKQAAHAMQEGILRAIPDAQCVCVPMADGGEGTVQSLVDATQGTLVEAQVSDPLGKSTTAVYGILSDGVTAVIEMAAASGIQYVNEQTKNPRITTTYGTGELIRDALDHGVRSFIIGLGGSATNDGGAGMAQALGVKFFDAQGEELPVGGAALANLERVDIAQLDPRLAQCSISLASDVTNPLTGERGSSAVFGPQKGADPQMVQELDTALRNYARVIREQLGIEVETVPGAGAAGGLGAGFLAFTNAQMHSGVKLVVEATQLAQQAVGAQYCFTGEGGIDFQTQYGKTPMGTAQAVKAVEPDCKVIAIAGSIGKGIDELYDLGIDAVFGIMPGPCTLDDAIANAQQNVARTAENIARLLS